MLILWYWVTDFRMKNPIIKFRGQFQAHVTFFCLLLRRVNIFDSPKWSRYVLWVHWTTAKLQLSFTFRNNSASLLEQYCCLMLEKCIASCNIHTVNGKKECLRMCIVFILFCAIWKIFIKKTWIVYGLKSVDFGALLMPFTVILCVF